MDVQVQPVVSAKLGSLRSLVFSSLFWCPLCVALTQTGKLAFFELHKHTHTHAYTLFVLSTCATDKCY